MKTRRLGTVLIGRVLDVPPDTRPIGALKSADHSQHVFAKAIHPVITSQEGLMGPTACFTAHQQGIRTVKSTTLKYDNPQWDARHPKDKI